MKIIVKGVLVALKIHVTSSNEHMSLKYGSHFFLDPFHFNNLIYTLPQKETQV